MLILRRCRSRFSGATHFVAVDGLAAYPNAIRKAFSDKFYSGKAGRPLLLPWSDLHIVQVVKQRQGYKLTKISRRLAHGCLNRVLV